MLPSQDRKSRLQLIACVRICIASLISIGLLSSASCVTLKYTITTFIDAGWASDIDDCRSQFGYAIYFGNSILDYLWRAPIQRLNTALLLLPLLR
ncbi:LOW QUALITY PROTEIN: hypothetical protein V2J09_005830 [Rumex salicifolius]